MKAELFKDLNVGDRVESLDSDGFYMMQYCGVIVAISKDKKDAIIKSFDGTYYSTDSTRKNHISKITKIN